MPPHASTLLSTWYDPCGGPGSASKESSSRRTPRVPGFLHPCFGPPNRHIYTGARGIHTHLLIRSSINASSSQAGQLDGLAKPNIQLSMTDFHGIPNNTAVSWWRDPGMRKGV
jgi:hypothetical protein